MDFTSETKTVAQAGADPGPDSGAYRRYGGAHRPAGEDAPYAPKPPRNFARRGNACRLQGRVGRPDGPGAHPAKSSRPDLSAAAVFRPAGLFRGRYGNGFGCGLHHAVRMGRADAGEQSGRTADTRFGRSSRGAELRTAEIAQPKRTSSARVTAHFNRAGAGGAT
jgi:hypothetical protein